MKAQLKRYRVFLVLLLINIGLVVFAPDMGIKSIEITKDSLKDLLSVVPPIFILLGLLDVWVKKDTMVKYMGKGSGIKGALIGFFIGSAAAGPLYAAFPVADVLISKRAKMTNVLIFIGAWSTTKIPLLLFEASAMGTKFTITRLLLNLPVIAIIAIAIDRLLTKEDLDNLYRNVGRE